jgi:hypothetical protein
MERDSAQFQNFCDGGLYPPLCLNALGKLTLSPTRFFAPCEVEDVLQMLGMVHSARRGIAVCLGDVVLNVPPRKYGAEFQKLVDGLASIGPPGMWVSCAHCVAHVGEISRRGLWCVHCRTSDNENWRDIL